jgi:hypothetical protein
MQTAGGTRRWFLWSDSLGGIRMRRRTLPASAGLLLLLAALASADPPPNIRVPRLENVLPLLDASSPEALAGVLRGALIQFLPNPLYEASPGWGNTREVARGLVWRGQGLHVHPEVTRSPKNDGLWRKIHLQATNLQDTLVFDLRDVRQPAPGRLTFTAFLSFDVDTEIEQQKWDAGVRVYSTSVRARLRARLRLDCEAEARLDFAGSLLPDAVFRLHVVRADLGYDNLVVEHAAGLGGTAARLLGEAVRSSLHRFHPSVERGLLEKADAALVRAGDTHEVRISLSRMFQRLAESQHPAGK